MTYQEQLEMLILECSDKWRIYAGAMAKDANPATDVMALKRELDQAENACKRCYYLISSQKVHPLATVQL